MDNTHNIFVTAALSNRDHYHHNYHLHHHHHHYHHHHNQLHRKRKTSHCRLTRTNSERSDRTYKTRNSVNSNNNNTRCSRLLKHCVEWFCNKIGSTQSHHHPHHPTSTAANTSPPSIGGSTNTGLHNEFETIADAQEALWFVRENIEKKKRFVIIFLLVFTIFIRDYYLIFFCGCFYLFIILFIFVFISVGPKKNLSLIV